MTVKYKGTVESFFEDVARDAKTVADPETEGPGSDA
jgi:hypothetical protein